MQIALETTAKKRIDRQGNPITNPLVLEELERLETKKAKNEYMTAKDKMRMNRLQKYGDLAIAKNKTCEPKPKSKPAGQQINLSTKTETTVAQLDKVIDDLFKGLNPFDTLKKYNISTRAFYSYLKSPKINKEYYNYIKEDYKERFNLEDITNDFENGINQENAFCFLFQQSREVFAESCFSRLLKLSEQLEHGEIDSSTYSAITYNLRWIMGKLFPAAYSEKIAVNQEVKTTTNQEVNIEKIKELATLI
jgi:hypothetical protein